MVKLRKNNTPDKQQEALHKLLRQRDTAFKRFPLLFALLGTFGLVATFYGFQHMIEKIPLLADNPIISLGLGIVVLAITGTLYKKLG